MGSSFAESAATTAISRAHRLSGSTSALRGGALVKSSNAATLKLSLSAHPESPLGSRPAATARHVNDQPRACVPGGQHGLVAPTPRCHAVVRPRHIAGLGIERYGACAHPNHQALVEALRARKWRSRQRSLSKRVFQSPPVRPRISSTSARHHRLHRPRPSAPRGAHDHRNAKTAPPSLLPRRRSTAMTVEGGVHAMKRVESVSSDQQDGALIITCHQRSTEGSVGWEDRQSSSSTSPPTASAAS